MKKRVGRPPKPPAVKVSALVSFAVTPDEEAQICRLARVKRQTVSAFIRQRLKDLGIFL